MGTSSDEPVRDDPAGEASLTRWRGRLLNGVISTSVLALAPAIAIQTWQWARGLAGVQPGLVLGVVAIAVLSALGAWRAPYQQRAAILMGFGLAVITAAILVDGLAPAQFVAICTLTTVGVLLYSLRAAYLVLSMSGLSIATAAFLFSRGYLDPPPEVYLDERNPLTWLRVGLYTLFPSATAAVATHYLLGKLRATLQARTQLVMQLSDEVAQREKALAELERAQARLLHAGKLEAIGQLAAGIAHDFNNTLSVVALEAELLKRGSQEPNGVARGAEALLGAAERGRQLTQQLLLFSRAEGGLRPVIDVTRTFEECVRALRRLLPSEISFELETVNEPLCVCIPPSELQQIVLNLGINARDAMPGGGSLHMSLRVVDLPRKAAESLGTSEGRYALLVCRDTGVGMEPATLARLFEPFFTTKGPGRGTGLGLTNVWNIAHRAGGAVHAQGAPGAGATLHVYLPLSAAAPTDQDVPSRSSGLHGHETLLVVEDDLRVRGLLVALLNDAGYRVLDAGSVDAALALEREHKGPLDLICTDVVMPGRPARDLIAELKLRRPKAAILVCSGYSEDEQIARGVRSGEWKHLAKPFTRQQLLAAVRSALDRSGEIVTQVLHEPN